MQLQLCPATHRTILSGRDKKRKERKKAATKAPTKGPTRIETGEAFGASPGTLPQHPHTLSSQARLKIPGITRLALRPTYASNTPFVLF